MTTGWSKLEKTALWNMARRAHFTDSWRTFQSFARVDRLYRLAGEVFSFPYSRSLDRAILCRSVVVGGSDPVRASAEWMMHRLPIADPEAEALIISTRLYIPDEDNRMLLLDLACYAFDDHRDRMIALQHREIERRFPAIPAEERRQLHVRRLIDIARNLHIGMENGRVPAADMGYLKSIHAGLSESIRALGAAHELARAS